MSAIEWRGIGLSLDPKSHRGYECWVSEGEKWKAERFREKDVWYGRVRVGAHRFWGSGSTTIEALESAREAAIAVLSELRKAVGTAHAPEKS